MTAEPLQAVDETMEDPSVPPPGTEDGSSNEPQKFDAAFNLFGQYSVHITYDTLLTFSSLVKALAAENQDTHALFTSDLSLEEEKGSPFFNLPGVGLSNPFLASFLESQIRQHLNALQLGMVTDALQAQSQLFQPKSEDIMEETKPKGETSNLTFLCIFE